jgi:hypothetical protein
LAAVVLLSLRKLFPSHFAWPLSFLSNCISRDERLCKGASSSYSSYRISQRSICVARVQRAQFYVLQVLAKPNLFSKRRIKFDREKAKVRQDEMRDSEE